MHQNCPLIIVKELLQPNLFFQNGIVVDCAEDQISADTYWQTGPGDKYVK